MRALHVVVSVQVQRTRGCAPDSFDDRWSQSTKHKQMSLLKSIESTVQTSLVLKSKKYSQEVERVEGGMNTQKGG